MSKQIEDALEQAICARMNLENLNQSASGALSQSPFYSITAIQLDEIIKILKGNENG